MASLVSWTAFYVTMFRLKKLMIYMDIQNETQADIERQLKRMRMLYTILLSTILMTVVLPLIYLLITQKNINSDFAIIYGVLCAVYLCMFLGTSIYLLRMLYQM
jgi:hypothetical protein